MKLSSKLISYLPHITLLIILLMRFHVIIVRFFDPDEFAHMHWAWLVARGLIPYKDFFFYNTIFYQWAMAPVFWLGNIWWLVYLVRFWQYLFYLGNLFFIYRIGKRLTGDKSVGLLSALILSVFPMTFDKTIDIRPDMVMMFFYLFSIDLLIQKKPIKPWHYFLSGLFLSLAIGIIPKIVFAIPATLYLFLLSKPRPFVKSVSAAFIGGLLPVMIFIGYLITQGVLSQALTSIFTDSLVVNAGKIPFSPWKALSPYPLVYLFKGGVSFPWIVNTAIWILSILGFVVFFLKKPAYGLYLTIFYIAGILFVFLFPAPYLQYFLPLSVFASFLAAYFIFNINNLISRKTNLLLTNLLIYLLLCPILFLSFFIQYRERANADSNNSEQIQVLKDITKLTGDSDTAYDMVGSYVFVRDGYFFCCHPYAEFIDKLNRPYPSLKESLIDRETRFLILDRTGMSLWQPKPDDLFYLETNYQQSPYRKIYIPGFSFACTGGVCTQFNIHGRSTNIVQNSFKINIPGVYELNIVPEGSTININGQNYGSSAINLHKGDYTFTVAPDVISFTVLMKIEEKLEK